MLMPTEQPMHLLLLPLGAVRLKYRMLCLCLPAENQSLRGVHLQDLRHYVCIYRLISRPPAGSTPSVLLSDRAVRELILFPNRGPQWCNMLARKRILPVVYSPKKPVLSSVARLPGCCTQCSALYHFLPGHP